MPVSWNLLPDTLLLVGDDDRVVEANDAAAALFGTSVSELLGCRFGSLLSCDLSTLADDTLVRDRIRRADGTPVPVDLLSVRAGSQRLVVVRKMPQERLLDEMRATLDIAFDSTPLCAALFNSEGQYIRVNENLCRLLGRAPDALLGRRDQEFTHPDDRAADLEAAWRILRGELDIWQTEKRFLRPDGSVVWVIANLTFLRDERGGPLGWLGQFQDITGRREMEAQLRERERLLRAGFDGAAIGMALVAPDGRCIRVNRALCAITGYSEAQLLGKCRLPLANVLVAGSASSYLGTWANRDRISRAMKNACSRPTTRSRQSATIFLAASGRPDHSSSRARPIAGGRHTQREPVSRRPTSSRSLRP